MPMLPVKVNPSSTVPSWRDCDPSVIIGSTKKMTSHSRPGTSRAYGTQLRRVGFGGMALPSGFIRARGVASDIVLDHRSRLGVLRCVEGEAVLRGPGQGDLL